MSSEGEVLAGRFRLEARLGSGTYGAVWRAYDQARARPVALKVLHRERRGHGTSRARFQREAEILGRLDHPNIVRAFAWAHDDEAPWLAMELIAGAPLSLVLGARADLGRPLLPHEVAHVVGAIADAVTCAHAHGVVHRDLKPRNVLIGPGDAGRVTVLDFGVAKLVDTPQGDATTVGRLLGSLLYMSPEQLRAEEVGVASDVFALATITYELLTLRRPWAVDERGVPLVARDVAVARDAVNNHATVLARISRGPRPSVSPWVTARAAELDQVLHAAWDPQPATRTPDVPTFARDLAGALGLPLGATETLLLDRAEATPTLRLAEPDAAPTSLVPRPASSPTVRLVEPEWVPTLVARPRDPLISSAHAAPLAAIAAAATVRSAQDPASAIGAAVTTRAPLGAAPPATGPEAAATQPVDAQDTAPPGAPPRAPSATVPLAERPPELHTEVHTPTRTDRPLRAPRGRRRWIISAAAAAAALTAVAGLVGPPGAPPAPAPEPAPSAPPAIGVLPGEGRPPEGRPHDDTSTDGHAVAAGAAGPETPPSATPRPAGPTPAADTPRLPRPAASAGARPAVVLASASARPHALAAAPASSPARARTPAHLEALARVARLSESSDAVELAEAAEAIARAARARPGPAAKRVEQRAQAVIMTPSLEELRRLAVALSQVLDAP